MECGMLTHRNLDRTRISERFLVHDGANKVGTPQDFQETAIGSCVQHAYGGGPMNGVRTTGCTSRMNWLARTAGGASTASELTTGQRRQAR